MMSRKASDLEMDELQKPKTGSTLVSQEQDSEAIIGTKE